LFRSAADVLTQEQRRPVESLTGLVECTGKGLEHMRHVSGDVEDDVDALLEEFPVGAATTSSMSAGNGCSGASR